MPTVYLAGPMVFAPEPEAIFSLMKQLCEAEGLQGISPLDNQLGLESLAPSHALLERSVRADIALMRSVDAGLFCLDAFRRGTEMDAGTAFEVGYMSALGKKLAGWTNDGRSYRQKVSDHFSGALLGSQPNVPPPNVYGGMSGTTRDPDGILVHSEGCLQNAMVHVGIELFGGAMFCDPNWQLAFAAAAAQLSSQLRRQDTADTQLGVETRS